MRFVSIKSCNTRVYALLSISNRSDPTVSKSKSIARFVFRSAFNSEANTSCCTCTRAANKKKKSCVAACSLQAVQIDRLGARVFHGFLRLLVDALASASVRFSREFSKEPLCRRTVSFREFRNEITTVSRSRESG